LLKLFKHFLHKPKSKLFNY